MATLLAIYPSIDGKLQNNHFLRDFFKEKVFLLVFFLLFWNFEFNWNIWNGPFQCLAKFLLKHEKQNQSPQLKRAYQK